MPRRRRYHYITLHDRRSMLTRRSPPAQRYAATTLGSLLLPVASSASRCRHFSPPPANPMVPPPATAIECHYAGCRCWFIGCQKHVPPAPAVQRPRRCHTPALQRCHCSAAAPESSFMPTSASGYTRHATHHYACHLFASLLISSAIHISAIRHMPTERCPLGDVHATLHHMLRY